MLGKAKGRHRLMNGYAPCVMSDVRCQVSDSKVRCCYQILDAGLNLRSNVPKEQLNSKSLHGICQLEAGFAFNKKKRYSDADPIASGILGTVQRAIRGKE